MKFSEFWLTDMYDTALLSWPHKNHHRIDRPDRAGGGLICYLSNKYFSHSSKIYESSIISPDIECLHVKVTVPNNKAMNIFTVYKPPKGDVVKFIDHLKKAFHNSKGEIWILGDFNVNFLDHDHTDTIAIKFVVIST